MSKITITKIYRSWKDKQGNPLKTKDGREYERVVVRCKEYGEKWVSGFGGLKNRDWKVGDEVEVEIEESGEYLNFKMPNPLRELEDRVKLLEDRLESHISDNASESIPEDEVKDEDIPF